MTFAQAMAIAILQGFSELFPISSLGHTVLIPALLRWNVDRSSSDFLAFVVALHLGTAAALLLFYQREWRGVVPAFVGSVVRGRLSGSSQEKLAWLLVIGTIPVGLLGFLLEHEVRGLFGSPLPVAVFLFANGLVMFAGEALKQRQHAAAAQAVGGQTVATGREYRTLNDLSFFDAVKVGLAESLALLPGISRSGSSIVAGLLIGLSESEAARYSFMLATPVILAAGLLEIPRLLAPGAHGIMLESVIGGILSAVTAYLSVAFLTRYFRTNDLRPFGWYCVVAGAVSFALFSSGIR